MKQMAFLGSALILAAALAGCTTTPPPSQTGGTATSIAITSYPSDAAPNSNATVCWHVGGSGRVQHTAVHYDTQSHPNPQSFNDYRGGTGYPGNASGQVAVDLPGDFCTRVPVGVSDVYFRAHVIDSRGGNGMLSDEAEIAPRAAPGAILGVRFEGSIPAAAPANGNVTVCWNVTGTGRIPHTAIHTDTVSHPTATSFSDYAGAAYYPDNATSQVPVDLPGTFCTDVLMPGSGTLYLRAHAMIQPPGQMSANEASIAVENTTTGPGLATTVDWASTVPTSAPAGSNLTVCWRVEGTGSVPHTAIHTDDESHAGSPTATFTDYDKTAYYPGNATGQVAVDLPGTFCTDVLMPGSGTLYLRAHVIDSTGAPGRLSLTEKAVAVG